MLAWLFGSTSQPPVFLKFRSSKTFIIVTVSTAVFTDVFIYEIIVPVLPFALTRRSGVNPDSIQTWISIFLAVYGAATLIASPFCGYLADMTTSRRMPFVLGLLALAGSTVMLFIGNSIGVLVAGRVLQGISAAVVGVVGLALLVDTVGPDAVGEAMGFVGLSMSLAILVGPMLSGIVYATAGYNAVFAMAFGLIGLDMLLRLIMVEKKAALQWLPSEQPQVQHDVPQGDSQAEPEADQALTRDPMEAQDPPEATVLKSTLVQVQSAQGIRALDAASSGKEIRGHLPPILHLLSSRRVLAALWACTIQASLLTAFDSILPLFVRNTFHWNSIGAGLIFLPIVVVSFIGPVVGKLSDKFGPRWFATGGFIGACPCLILLRLVDQNTLNQKVLLCALLALFAIAVSCVITPIMAEIAYAVAAKAQRRPPGFFGENGAYAQAYSLFNMSWAAGSMIGPLLGGLVTERAGWRTATLILGIISLATSVPTAIWTGGSIWKKRRTSHDDENAGGGTQSAVAA
ncbi:Hypothetical protein R9X50_00788400 [Acrodontium crateriforme]|uniref:Major facilitator superfamily (MFS) profile domain-containing protein n=1 Tax=Acrodontium crateriforme TaxID=150365 RepID=A0AAQ3R837_9PEZI|nr:Hypothetical protein R9X50_00788400 [Acrodontium crateriforme]